MLFHLNVVVWLKQSIECLNKVGEECEKRRIKVGIELSLLSFCIQSLLQRLCNVVIAAVFDKTQRSASELRELV